MSVWLWTCLLLVLYPALHFLAWLEYPVLSRWIAEENFTVTTRKPYRERTQRIRIWSCFLQRLGNVCCDVTWYLPDRFLLLVCFSLLFSLSQHHPRLSLSSHGPTLKRLHWNGGPFHLCHSSILLWYVLISPIKSSWYSSEDFIAMCTVSTPSLFSRFFWRLSFWPIDAVVLWDWIISLPREYRFVRSPQAPLFLILPFCLGMENSLDSSQDSISLLPVSLCDVLIVSYIHEFTVYLVTGLSLLYHTCFSASSLTIQEKHARESTRLVFLVRLKSSSNHHPVEDPSGSCYVESSRVRM